MIVFGFLIQPALKQISEDSQKDGQAKQTVLGEMINGLETVKLFLRIFKKDRWMGAVNAQSKTSIKFSTVSINFAGIGQQLSQLVLLASAC